MDIIIVHGIYKPTYKYGGSTLEVVCKVDSVASFTTLSMQVSSMATMFALEKCCISQHISLPYYATLKLHFVVLNR